MKTHYKEPKPSLRKQAISLAVLVGFLCILFHPLTHLNIDLFAAHNDVDHTEFLYIAFNDHSSEQHDDHSSEQHDDHTECPECILKKHIQIDLSQNVSLPLNDKFQYIKIYQDSPNYQFAHLSFYLRGPPSNIV
jgi:hypothetical protein